MKLEELQEDQWSGDVTKNVTSHPKDDLYASGSAQEIADSEEKREGSAGGAIKAITFYKNRAGVNLSDERKKVIDDAVAILQKKNNSK